MNFKNLISLAEAASICGLSSNHLAVLSGAGKYHYRGSYQRLIMVLLGK